MYMCFKMNRVVKNYPKQGKRRAKITLLHEPLNYSRTFFRPINLKRFFEAHGIQILKEDEELIKGLFRLTSEERICRQTQARKRAMNPVHHEKLEVKREEAHHNIDWEDMIPQLPIIIKLDQKKELEASQSEAEENFDAEDTVTNVLPEDIVKVEMSCP